MAERLRQAVIAYETEAAAAARLIGHGYAPEIAAEIAVYLAQATDLPAHMPEIATALAAEDVAFALRAARCAGRLAAAAGGGARGDAAVEPDRRHPVLSRIVRAGAGAAARPAALRRAGGARSICARTSSPSLALAAAAGLPCPPTLLLRGRAEIAALGGAARRRAVFRQAEHARRQARHFRRQPLRHLAPRRRARAARCGTATPTARWCSPISTAPMCG